jgi:hypothetical protein
MPFKPEDYEGSGSSQVTGNNINEGYRMERSQSGVVFSAHGSYNPTSLAVQHSLKEIFDEFTVMVTGELRQFDLEEDDKPVF